MRRNVSRTGIVRKQRHQRFAIKDWADTLPDVPAFIIGNGPSLKDEDLTVLESYFTIGINRAFYLIDPTILMWQDISLWTTEHHRIHNLQSLKVARDIADPRRIYYNFYLKGSNYKFDNKTHILHGRGSTGPLAVQLAVAMGCSPIVLLGMDCKKAENGDTDFYGHNNHWYPHTLSNCKIGLDFIRNECRTEIINCSNNDVWERHSLKSVLKNIDQKHSRNRQSYVKQITRAKK